MFDFQPDQAISKLESDRLDRAHFVESISNTVIKPGGIAATGVVLGLVGRWGEGKTSILQLLRADLRERYPKAVVVEFSPWLVSKRHDLLHAFFDELDRSLGAHLEEPIHGSRQSQLIEELSSAIADYLDRVAPVIEMLEPVSAKAIKLRDVADTLLALFARPTAAALDLSYIVQTLSRSGAYEAASILIRKISLRLERGSSLFQRALVTAGIGEPWLRTVGQNVVRDAKARAQATQQLVPVAVAYLARDVGFWSDADRSHYQSILSSDDQAFDRFIIDSFGGQYTSDGKTIDEFFMQLDNFVERVKQRQAGLGKDADPILRKAYDKTFDWLNIE